MLRAITAYGLALVVALAFFAGSAPLAAQDCGEYCNACGGPGWKEGTGFHPEGYYNMACKAVGVGNPCWSHGCGTGASHSESMPSEVVANAVELAAVADLALLAEAYGDRLLVVPERNAVVVRGVPCDENWLSHMVFVPAETVVDLQRLGVDTVESYFRALDGL